MKKILITGGRGQLGRECSEALIGRFQVLPLSSKDLDITNHDAIKSVLGAEKPDIVLNCAAFTDVDGCETRTETAWKVNSEGPAHLAMETKRTGARLIHISTDYVFDGKKSVPNPYIESDAPKPLSWYGKSKLAGEQAIIRITENHLIIRTAWLYSIYGKNFLKTVIRLALGRAGKGIRVVNDQYGSPTWAHRLALQIEKLIDNDATGVCHATAEGYGTWCQVASHLIKTLGIDCEIAPCSSEEYPTAAQRPKNSILENRYMKEKSICIMEEWKKDLELFADKFRTDLFPVGA